MRRGLLIFLTIACVPSAFADDPEREILEHFLCEVFQVMNSHDALPAVLASETTGGREMFAREWMLNHRGKVIALEVADSYDNVNAERHAVESMMFVRGVPPVDFSGAADEEFWLKLEASHPGTKTVVVLSRPAMDRLGGIALVRADVIRRGGDSWTMFVDYERQADQTWNTTIGSHGPYDPEDEYHLHPANDAAYYHER